MMFDTLLHLPRCVSDASLHSVFPVFACEKVDSKLLRWLCNKDTKTQT
jgi:hypothetical protein